MDIVKPAITLPPLPWSYYPSHDPDRNGFVADSDTTPLCLVKEGAHELGVLFALAPELLGDLAAIVRAIVQQDEDYRRQHGITLDADASREALLDALSHAVATLAYAHHEGLPVDLPGLLDLENTL